MAATKPARRAGAKDLQGIRRRGGSYQVRVYGGREPQTGKRLTTLTGSAIDEAAAIRLHDCHGQLMTLGVMSWPGCWTGTTRNDLQILHERPGR